MVIKAAVFMNEAGETESLFEEGILAIYLHKDEKWKLIGKNRFKLEMTSGIKGIRDGVRTLIAMLSGCKAFAAAEISGVPYNLLDGAGFHIYEMKVGAEELLDYIYAVESSSGEEEEEDVTEAVDVPTRPLETNIAGNYFFDLGLLQESKSKVTSKQALIPFLRNVEFKRLEIRCGHIPPWIERELEENNMLMSFEKTGLNEYKVVIMGHREKERV